ncbi:MAG: RIP metalloprotease RseP [Streptococcaceae bacterium]|nr:RIP metalloprotease RseP [Streptococcaceae bacterium]
MIINVIVFIIVFGVIVAIHEYGHLWFAKRAGILVREYAIGMGPLLFSHRAKDGTLYSIRMLPVGGYVRMAGWGDDATEIKKGAPAAIVLGNGQEGASSISAEPSQALTTEPGLVTRINLSEKIELENAIPMLVTAYDFVDDLFIEGEVAGEVKRYSISHEATVIEEDGTELKIAPKDVQYQSATVWGKITTNFAGPLNNFILGLVAFILVVFMQGGVPSNSNQIGQVEKGSPAAVAGLQAGDKLTEIGGKSVSNWTELTSAITSDTSGKKLDVQFTRNGEKKTTTVTPKEIDGSYKFGVTNSIKTDLWSKISGGFSMTIDAMGLIGRALGHLFTHPSLNQLGGPVAIFQATGQAAQGGFISVLGFLALLSINLGIVNLIPIPALDGGKIVLNIIEWIRRKPMKPEHESIVTMVGAVFMIVLMLAVTWNDIMRAIGH